MSLLGGSTAQGEEGQRVVAVAVAVAVVVDVIDVVVGVANPQI